jgi:hypothetical protein
VSRRCPCRSRVCEIVVPNHTEFYPDEGKVRVLKPYIGTIVDLAADYDRCADDGELTTAVDFATWLQITAAPDISADMARQQYRLDHAAEQKGRAA